MERFFYRGEAGRVGFFFFFFLVLMLYASLDRLCQMGMERKPVRPLETQGSCICTRKEGGGGGTEQQ